MTRPRTALAGLILLAAANLARAGSTEPELALAVAAPTVDDGVVMLALRGNWDFANWTRLGYPIVVVITRGAVEARLAFTGGATVATGGGPPVPVAGAPGVVAVAADRADAVVPAALAASGTATVRLEADVDGTLLVSNAVEASW